MSSKHQRLILLAILALAVLLRLGVALYLGDRVEVLPGIHDQLSYDHLAQQILAGKGYQFDTNWYPFTPAGTPTAHWSFLYPLYLAGVYAVVGYHPLIARLLQAIIAGIMLPWLAFRLGRRLWGVPAGLAAALMMAFYGYFIYHNAALMTETFYMVLILWTFDLAYQMRKTGNNRYWWLLGLNMGLIVLLRQVFLFFVPVLLLWLAWDSHVSRLRLFLAGIIVILCIFPWTARNYLKYKQFLLLNSNSGYALYTANHPDQGTTWQPYYVAPIPTDLQGKNEAVLDRELTARGLAFITADPVRYLQLTLSRIPYHFRFWPSSDAGLTSNIIRAISFGFYLPFMLVGLYLSRSDWRQLLPFYLFALLFIGLHVASWPGPRYRFPVDALFMVFAGLAIAHTLAHLLTLRHKPKTIMAEVHDI